MGRFWTDVKSRCHRLCSNYYRTEFVYCPTRWLFTFLRGYDCCKIIYFKLVIIVALMPKATVPFWLYKGIFVS